MKHERCDAVGAIVKNSKGHYLVLYRLQQPQGLGCPAGHVEGDETRVEAVTLELFEETGIRAKKTACVYRGVFGTARLRCKRGVSKHKWSIYRVLTYVGKARRKEKREHAFVKFMSPKKIREYANRNDLTPLWVEVFRQLKIINGRTNHT